MGFRDVTDVALIPMTEEQLAMSPPLSSSGRTIEHLGRYWRQSYPGLYEPVHLLARSNAREASRPSRLCWGFHTTLADDALHLANASKPIHLLADLESFDPQSISSNRRYQLRRSQRSVEFTHVADVDALDTVGYEVVRSALDRTQQPWRQVESREEFLDELRWFTGRPSTVIIAGLVDGNLGGWIAGFAVDETAYIEIVDLSTDALRWHLSIGLHFEFIEACRRSGSIREIVHSPHIPEDRALYTFKTSIGFPVVHVPSRFVMAPLAATLVKRRKPFLYYRLTGRATGPVTAALAMGTGTEPNVSAPDR